MNLKQLRYVAYVAESASISRAAQALNIAQPSLSHHISELEAELGVKLFHRTASGVTPTAPGHMFADRARAILRSIEALTHEVRHVGVAPVGEVMVGLPTTMALHLTVPLVQAVRERFPGIRLRISEGMSGHIQEWVLSGRLDIAILYTAGPVDDLDIELVTSEELCLVSRPSGQTAPLKMRELSKYPLVLPGPDHGLRRTIERICRSAGVDLTVAVEVDSLPNMKLLAADGALHTILPAAACREDMAAGRLAVRKIVQPPLSRPIALATPRNRPMTAAMEHVRLLLRDLIADALRIGD